MNKHYLQSKIKSSGTAYLFWFLFGAHYAYLDKWGIQILYWLTLGGFGFWALYDLFTMSSKVNKHNSRIFQELDEIDKKEKKDDHARNMELYSSVKKNENVVPQ